MNITISSKELASRLKIISKAIDKRSMLPILSSILFNVQEDGKLVLVGGSSEVSVRMVVSNVQTDTHGYFAVNAESITPAIMNLPEQPITLKENSTKLTVEYANGHFTLPLVVESIEGYPAQAKVKDDCKQFDINTKDLQRIIGYTLPMTDNSELRPVMNGIYCGLSDNGDKVFVASDGHILAKTVVGEENDVTGSFIMPKNVCSLLGTALTNDNTHIKFDERVAEIETNGCKISFVQIEGRYPRYNNVIPQRDNTATFDRLSFLGAVRRTSAFSSSSSELLVLELRAIEEQLEVSAEDADFCKSGKETIDCHCSQDMRIGVKFSNLTEIVNCLSNEQLAMGYISPYKPVVFSENDEENNIHITALVMPMLIQEEQWKQTI